MRTKLCETLGIDIPIIQAAIGSAAGPALAAAVCQAGGMGALGLTGWGEQGTAARLNETRALTDRSFIGNVLLPLNVKGEIAALLEAPPRVISFYWGDVAPYASRVHDAGALVMANVGSIEEAERAAEAGADIVVAQGWEAGGHVRGTTATLALIPAVVDAISPVPVVAAGGIADGRGLAAALCLGAQAAWIGTAFLAAEEADIHPAYRARVLSGTVDETVYGTAYEYGWPGAPGRVLRNQSVDLWEGAGRPDLGAKPREDDIVAWDEEGNPIKRYTAIVARSGMTGDVEDLPLWAGQGVGLVNKVRPASEIVQSIVSEARRILAANAGLPV